MNPIQCPIGPGEIATKNLLFGIQSLASWEVAMSMIMVEAIVLFCSSMDYLAL
jgi:hypothetical protein